ncbi:MAG: magnesium transporter [Candidatus Cyclobacteriaceae bacterium M3_2C_046]
MIRFELSREYFEWLKDAIEQQRSDDIRQSMEEANPADLASLLDEFDTEESKYVIQNLEEEFAAEVITYIDDDVRQRFLINFEPVEVARYLDHIDSDDAADILNDMPIKFREKIIAALQNDEQATYILELIKYDEDCAGGLMAKELIKASLNWSVVQTIEEIRRQAENVEKIYTVYAVNDRNEFLGRVSLKKIILANDQTKIADLYESDVVAVETFMEAEEVASIMQKYDLEAVPVINVKGKLVGRITIDDVIDVITEMAEQERQMMSGLSEDVEEDDSIWMLTRARLPWLIVGLAGGLIGAQFIGIFEEDIALIPAMAFFIPLITATGGNVGIQSSSIVVQTLASNDPFYGSYFNRIMKVLIVAIINGVVLAVLVFSANILIGMDNQIALVVSIALFSVVLLASFMGTITPILLDKVGINPALASGPFITTANDLLGLAVYFAVAHLLYGF